MAKVRYKRGSSGNLDKVPPIDGQILYATDNNELYIDTDKGRGKITDTKKVDKTTTIADLTLENNIKKKDLKNALDIEDIESKIPSEASSTNQLATQEDIEALGTVFNYKGSVNNYSDLENLESPPKPGDVWNIKNADLDHSIKAGDNVVRTSNNDWDILSGDVGYLKNNYKITIGGTSYPITFKGQVENKTELPKSDNAIGDIYNLKSKTPAETGQGVYIWIGEGEGNEWQTVESQSQQGNISNNTNNSIVPFIAEYGITTFEEVFEAEQSGRPVFCHFVNPDTKNSMILPLVNARKRKGTTYSNEDPLHISIYSFAAPYWTNAYNEELFKGRNEATIRVFVQRINWSGKGFHDSWEYDENYNVYVIPYLDPEDTTSSLSEAEYNRLIELYKAGKTVVVKGVPYGGKTYNLYMENYDNNDGITFSDFINNNNIQGLKIILQKNNREFGEIQVISNKVYTIPFYTLQNKCTENEFLDIAEKVLNGYTVITQVADPTNDLWHLNLRASALTYRSGYTPALENVINIMFSSVAQPASTSETPSIYNYNAYLNKNQLNFSKPKKQEILKTTNYITAGQKSGTTLGTKATAEGLNTTASGDYSHVEGINTTASGTSAHAEGQGTKAIGARSHAEGYNTTASSDYSHAEGQSTTASGLYSHAEGYNTVASGQYSHASGQWNIAGHTNQTVIGKYNKNKTDTLFEVGNGTSASDRRNAFTVDKDGNGFFAGAVSSQGADYAEFFEWLDGNPDNEDRVGRVVALDGDKIRYANFGDEILGIISGTVAVLGNNYESEWQGRYLKDDFGRLIYEPYEYKDIRVNPETGEEIEIIKTGTRPKLNPNYNPEEQYIPRSQRPEWSPVGMVGKLFLRDDGTCQVNGYVKPADGGIGTAADGKTNIRVLKRVNENIIQVLLK